MDRVRFGRALGYGARHAAKSFAKALDAAASPRPVSPNSVRAGAAPVSAEVAPGSADVTPTGVAGRTVAAGETAGGPGSAASQTARGAFAGRLAQARAGTRQARANAGHLRRSVWGPLAKFSGVVWLQVTGTFFALIAAFLSQGLWKQRGALHLPVNSPEAEKLYLHAAAFAIFAYFAVSSFVRAHLRQRR